MQDSNTLTQSSKQASKQATGAAAGAIFCFQIRQHHHVTAFIAAHNRKGLGAPTKRICASGTHTRQSCQRWIILPWLNVRESKPNLQTLAIQVCFRRLELFERVSLRSKLIEAIQFSSGQLACHDALKISLRFVGCIWCVLVGGTRANRRIWFGWLACHSDELTDSPSGTNPTLCCFPLML